MTTPNHPTTSNTFAIGDGMKSITVPDRYYAELEEENNTLLLYPETNDVWIRISVMTFEPKNKTENPMFDYNIQQAKKEGKEIHIVDDKSYYVESKQSEEDGDPIVIHFYDVGYKLNKILISVTTLKHTSETEEFHSLLAEIPEYISTIKEISPDKQNFFDLTDNDCRYINKRSAEILGIDEENLDDFHESDDTLKTIQTILDENKYIAENTYELQSLGIAFGDYIQYKHPQFQWSILHDSYGRDYCLIYSETTITIFPQTMISKRVEDGEEFNVTSLLKGLLKTIADMAESNQYKNKNEMN